jgi:Ca2+-binding RTX toxin-like protein
LVVNYTVNGGASIGTDFTGIAATGTIKTITFAANSSTATLSVDPTADTDAEADETINLTLASSASYGIGTSGAISGTIRNDDRIGTAAADSLTGSSGNDYIDGRAGVDTLTGGLGSDRFGFWYGQSSIATPDRITDFQIGTDKIDLFSSTGGTLSSPSAFTRAADNSTASTLSTLASAVFTDANGAAAGNQALAVNGAVLVTATNPAIAGTYLLINDATAVLSSSIDLMINITSFTGTLPAVGSLSVGSMFV